MSEVRKFGTLALMYMDYGAFLEGEYAIKKR